MKAILVPLGEVDDFAPLDEVDCAPLYKADCCFGGLSVLKTNFPARFSRFPP